jgi:hypothetical protein
MRDMVCLHRMNRATGHRTAIPWRFAHVAAVLGLGLASAVGCAADDGSAPLDETSEGSSSAQVDTSEGSTTGLDVMCLPGELRCSGDLAAIERCAPTGKAWIAEPCSSMTTCVPCDNDNCTAPQCEGLCESEDELPSSAGCSFIVNRQLHEFEQLPDGIVVANPNSEVVATVRHYGTPEGRSDEELLEEIVLGPYEGHIFELTTNFVQSQSSMFRTGGSHRIASDVPVIAYHHAPLQMARSNDSSMLLPESALRREYVIPSYSPYADHPVGGGEPSYFEVVALENFTTLTWTPPADTAGNGLPVPFTAAGTTGTLKMNRFDTVRIAASGNLQEDTNLRDVSGTLVSADKNIWVTAGVRCARVPMRDPVEFPSGRCDPLQELVIPLEYWGTRYVAPASPPRDSERHYWRVYAGKPGVTVTTTPAQEGTPFTLENRGDYFEFSVPHGTHFMFEGDGAFMPVQYMQSNRASSEPIEASTEKGAPSMYQMVPVEQFLSRYVFATALNFPVNYVQVIRRIGGAEVVYKDDAFVTGYLPAGDEYEVADYALPEANEAEDAIHWLESDEPFGIIQIGYSLPEVDDDCFLEPEYEGLACYSSYAYPGGMKSEPIFIP